MDTYENSTGGETQEGTFNPQPEQPEYQQTSRRPEYEYQQTSQRPEPWEQEPQKPKKERHILRNFMLCLLVVVLAAAGSGVTALVVSNQWAATNKRHEQIEQQLNQQIEDLEAQIKDNSFTGSGNSVSGTPNAGAGDSLTPGQVYAQNVGSVVAISNQATTTNIFGQVAQTASSGSGFVISEDGYVVTNFHVVEGAQKLTVITHNEKRYDAKFVGGDKANDLAVLKIDAEGLQHVKLGSSDDLIVGDQVAAIGNPLGELTSTLTVGFISAKDRDIANTSGMINMLQTDAAINPGNSGGPLFNMKGEVIGINSAKYSGTTNSGATIEGIGFAIPIDDVAKKISDLMEHGYITGGYLGVAVKEMDRATAESFGIPMGAYVVDVTEGFCAEKAGIHPKDLIVGVGDHEITGTNDLSRALQEFKEGDQTTITVWRKGVEVKLDITLDAKPRPQG